MSLMADALQPHIVGGLVALAGRLPNITLPDVLTSQQRAGYDLDFDEGTQRIIVDFRDPTLVVTAIGADCCRFASAALQTVGPIQSELLNKESVAWGIVKLYYAAFYSGHALLRLLGETCSYFDRSHVDRIGTMAMLTGRVPTFGVGVGLYHCTINTGATGFGCRRTTGAAGGAHESFWNVLGSRIQFLASAIAANPVGLGTSEAGDVLLKLERLRALLRAAGSNLYGYLSTVRNNVQYRQQLGVWLPVALGRRDREALSRIAGQWERDPMAVDLELGSVGNLTGFTAACIFIVATCRALLIRVAQRSTVGHRCFIGFGPLAPIAAAR